MNTQKSKMHPALYAHRYKTDRLEPCTEQVNVRMPLSLKQKLKAQDNWQEFVRQTLTEALEKSERIGKKRQV